MSVTASTAELDLLRRQKALARLARQDMLLAPAPNGRFHGVYPKGDRRRRPLARLTPVDVGALLADGALTPAGFAGAYRLSAAGHARHAREAAAELPFRQQHDALVERLVIGTDGDLKKTRGAALGGPFARLVKAVDHDFFAPRDIAAARRLWEDWAQSQRGLIGGSDWQAPPRGTTSRGPGGAQERAMAKSIDARKRVADALGALPLSLSGAVQAACLEGAGFEELERKRRWPQRSGKLVLKLALELLADHYGIG